MGLWHRLSRRTKTRLAWISISPPVSTNVRQFRAVGKVTGEVILSVLFAAAARVSSIHATCRRLDKAPCEETFTAAFDPQLHVLNALKRRINAAFADHLPRALRRRRKRPLALAIDLTLIASYGRHRLDDAHIYRSQAQRGPTRSSPTPPPL